MTTTTEHSAVDTRARFYFLDGPIPGAAGAEYSVQVTAYGLNAGGTAPAARPSENPVTVSSPRFHLDPDSVVATYPPPGAVGDFALVLPHIELTRASLPWERPLGSAQDTPTPWLALLLFADDDLVVTRTGTVEQLLRLPDQHVRGPRIDPDSVPAEQRTPRCTAIDVPIDLAAAVMPRLEETRYLAHTRQVATGSSPATHLRVGPGGHAVVVGNRFPRRTAARYTAHLVSLEGHADLSVLNPDQRSGATAVRFVSLWSWSFANQPGDRQNFAMLAAAMRTPGKDRWLRLPEASVPPQTRSHATAAHGRLAAGYVPVSVSSPGGEVTMGWYRGPFTPIAPQRPSRGAAGYASAGDAVGYDDSDGSIDLSYSAAFALGRMVALANPDRAHAIDRVRAGLPSRKALIQQLAAEGILDPAHRTQPDPPRHTGEGTPPLSATTLLSAIPADHLVPDPSMLPPESIRLFHVDHHWVDALRQGASTAGIDTTTLDTWLDSAIQEARAGTPAPPPVSGMLVRSSLVQAWPDLVVVPHQEGSATKPAPTLTRRLAPDVLLILFGGTPDTVTISEPPQALSFGLADIAGAGVIGLRRLTKDNCDRLGQDFAVTGQQGSTGYLRPAPNGGQDVVDVRALAESLTTALRSADALDQSSITPAGLALQLVTTPQQVTIPTFTT